MKKVYCLIVIVCCILSTTMAQQQSYSKVRVSFKSGITVKGAKGIINQQSITFLESGLQKSYPLTDIRLVEAKKGSTVYWALGCGGGCLALCAITIAANDPVSSGYENDQLVAGAAIWTVFSVGAGVLIGQLTDKYKPVYTSSSSSLFNRFDLGVSTARVTKFSPIKPSLTLSYKF